MNAKTVRVNDHFGYAEVVDNSILLPRWHENGTKNGNRKAALLICHPDCRRQFVATFSDLLSGRTVSCGCRGDTLDVQMLKRDIRRLARAAGYQVTALRLAPRAEAAHD